MSNRDIAGDPTLLLHHVDPSARRLVFRRTNAQSLRDAAFIDGRTDIWEGNPVELPFSVAMGECPAVTLPRRYAFHMSFCGSTLLARLLDRPGKVLALKEPNCLVDLADWWTVLAAAKESSPDFEPILHFARSMLARAWAPGEQVVVKPSSWANNLISDLAATPDASRVIFVTIARDAFLDAVLRGGTNRLAFTARLAAHLSGFVDGGTALLQQAIDSTPDPVGKAARLALVAHDLQLRLFESAAEPSAIIDFAEIEDDPAAAAFRAAAALELAIDAADIDANCSRWTHANAKADAAYSNDQRRLENERVRAHYGEIIDGGLQWAERSLGRRRFQVRQQG